MDHNTYPKCPAWVFFYYLQSIIRFIEISKLLLEEGGEEKAGGDGDQEVS